MKNQPAMVRLQSLLGRFGRSEQGNIAMLFGIAVVPIITFVGAAVDYTRANTARSSMQAAMDSASLMLAKDLQDGTITTAQIEQKAQDYFKALYHNPDAKSVGVTATYTAAAGNGSRASMAARMRWTATSPQHTGKCAIGMCRSANPMRSSVSRLLSSPRSANKIKYGNSAPSCPRNGSPRDCASRSPVTSVVLPAPLEPPISGTRPRGHQPSYVSSGRRM